VSILFSATAFAGPPDSSDWPQWQDPDRNVVSKERGLPADARLDNAPSDLALVVEFPAVKPK
jgi:hypothetical protein